MESFSHIQQLQQCAQGYVLQETVSYLRASTSFIALAASIASAVLFTMGLVRYHYCFIRLSYLTLLGNYSFKVIVAIAAISMNKKLNVECQKELEKDNIYVTTANHDLEMKLLLEAITGFVIALGSLGLGELCYRVYSLPNHHANSIIILDEYTYKTIATIVLFPYTSTCCDIVSCIATLKKIKSPMHIKKTKDAMDHKIAVLKHNISKAECMTSCVAACS